MMAWLLSIPTDKLEEEYESLKNQLTQHYREELQFIFAHQRMSPTVRASFYGAKGAGDETDFARGRVGSNTGHD